MAFEVKKQNYAPFPRLNGFLHENELQINDDILEVIKCYVTILVDETYRYFPNQQEVQKCCHFINNPFGTKASDLPSKGNFIQEQFIYLVAKRIFSEMCCSDFWTEMAVLS